MTDIIADMLTRIRNALVARHETVDIPCATIKLEIARILTAEGYIKGYTVVEEGIVKTIRVALKYGPSREKVITGIKRISRPGLRVFARRDNLPTVLNGMGIAIISTSKGVMTDKEAKKLGIGGEVLAYVW